MVIVSSVVHAGSQRNRPNVHLDDLNFNTRKFNNFAAYAEAKVAVVMMHQTIQARILAKAVSCIETKNVKMAGGP